MAIPSRGVFGNPPPQIGQEIDLLCSNTLEKTCGIGGCLKNNRHPTYLKSSHGENSNYD
jgi:hypothetical protein